MRRTGGPERTARADVRYTPYPQQRARSGTDETSFTPFLQRLVSQQDRGTTPNGRSAMPLVGCEPAICIIPFARPKKLSVEVAPEALLALGMPDGLFVGQMGIEAMHFVAPAGHTARSFPVRLPPGGWVSVGVIGLILHNTLGPCMINRSGQMRRVARNGDRLIVSSKAEGQKVDSATDAQRFLDPVTKACYVFRGATVRPDDIEETDHDARLVTSLSDAGRVVDRGMVRSNACAGKMVIEHFLPQAKGGRTSRLLTRAPPSSADLVSLIDGSRLPMPVDYEPRRGECVIGQQGHVVFCRGDRHDHGNREVVVLDPVRGDTVENSKLQLSTFEEELGRGRPDTVQNGQLVRPSVEPRHLPWGVRARVLHSLTGDEVEDKAVLSSQPRVLGRLPPGFDEHFLSVTPGGMVVCLDTSKSQMWSVHLCSLTGIDGRPMDWASVRPVPGEVADSGAGWGR